MLLYRVFAYDPNASAGQSGHPGYLYPGQGAGRWDNPDLYLGWYLASNAAAAVGEVFGNLALWRDSMFEVPYLDGARRALAVYSVPDALTLLDLDDASALVERALRPTQVVSPNRRVTQRIARDIAGECDAGGVPLWAGLSWWSSWRSYWPVHFVWGHTPTCESVEALDLDHPAVRDAATALSRALA